MTVNARPTAKNYTNPSYRRPDHPSFQEKRHSMIVDAQGASNKEIRTESGTLKFENGVAVLANDSRARDIVDELRGSTNPSVRALHPNQYSLIENKPTVNTDTIHRMRITNPGMPWARYDELGRRILDEG